MSYKWFKHWQREHPGAVILIETRTGYLSYEESACAVYRLTSQPLFVPERRERVRGLAISVPRKEFPILLDRLMRCRISHLVAREDYLVYQKAYDARFYQIYAAPIRSISDAEDARLDRPVGMDDRITVKNLETHKEFVWTLVPEEDADVAKREKSGTLSADSAVGAQLIGCFCGEDVAVTDEDGIVTKYRIMLAIDPEGRKLKKHRRAAEEEVDEEPPAEETSTEAESTPPPDPPTEIDSAEDPVEPAADPAQPVEESVAEPTDEIAENPAEPAAEPAEPFSPAPIADDPAAPETVEDSAEPPAKVVAAEIPASADIPAEAPSETVPSEEPGDESVPAEASAFEEIWEDTDAGTPFFRRKKVTRPVGGQTAAPTAPQHFATPDRPVPPELQSAGKRQKPKHVRTGKWFGKKGD